MAKDQYISEIGAYVEYIESIGAHGSTILFRGQDCNAPLLPKIARHDPTVDTVKREREMLDELKRRTARQPTVLGQDDWDALVVAQHFGLSTRLLDWTTNPLIALWFAISNLKFTDDGYVFMLPVTNDLLLDRASEPDPFTIKKTRVFKPSINNERLAVQAGWFTVHRYSKKSEKFVDLHKNTELKDQVLMKGIKRTEKDRLLRGLDRLGINYESLFPGLEGTCRYVDWTFAPNAS